MVNCWAGRFGRRHAFHIPEVSFRWPCKPLHRISNPPVAKKRVLEITPARSAAAGQRVAPVILCCYNHPAISAKVSAMFNSTSTTTVSTRWRFFHSRFFEVTYRHRRGLTSDRKVEGGKSITATTAAVILSMHTRQHRGRQRRDARQGHDSCIDAAGRRFSRCVRAC